MVQNQYSVQFFFCRERQHELQASTTLLFNQQQTKGKMKILLLIILTLLREYTLKEVDLGEVELPKNILKFGYTIKYRYVGKVSHSFDRFYVVTKF